jgi:hypothetical protein
LIVENGDDMVAAMQMPANMSAPALALDGGETVLVQEPVLRRKGIFGNRYGELVVTNRRVVFMKATMGVVGALANKVARKPMLTFDRATLSVDKLPVKKHIAVVVTSGGSSERFLTDESGADRVIAALKD